MKKELVSLICVIRGKVWRDLNGDQKPQPIEPNLNAKDFWDIDENGEHNESTEPNITTNKEGEFAFEWIC